jgi:CrcB protein
MSMLLPVLVGVGSAVGAVARYGVSCWVAKVNSSIFPWGTWLINMVGTALFGLFTFRFQNTSPDLMMLFGTGFCGGFTTFSTLSVETVTLFRSNRLVGVVYLVSSLGVGCILAWLMDVWM